MSLKENKSIKSSNKSHKNFFFNYKEYICGWIGGNKFANDFKIINIINLKG